MPKKSREKPRTKAKATPGKAAFKKAVTGKAPKSKSKVSSKKVVKKQALKPRPKTSSKKAVTKQALKLKPKAPAKKAAPAKAAAKKLSPKAMIRKAASKSASRRAELKTAFEKAAAGRQNKNVVENDVKANLRRLLVQKREEIVKEAKAEIKKYISGENKQLVETVLDEGDLSVIDLSEDISLKQLSTHREVMIKIDAALRKLEEGTYGICEECGDEISEQRLKILPFAIFCRDCQEKKEFLEKLEKEVR